jgi:hypothetical protein
MRDALGFLLGLTIAAFERVRAAVVGTGEVTIDVPDNVLLPGVLYGSPFMLPARLTWVSLQPLDLTKYHRAKNEDYWRGHDPSTVQINNAATARLADGLWRHELELVETNPVDVAVLTPDGERYEIDYYPRADFGELISRWAYRKLA